MRARWPGLALGLFLGLLALGGGAVAAERVALVIGNGDYASPRLPDLPNPPNDARAMARALEEVGFEVIAGVDLGIEAMQARIREFQKALAGARVGLVFYAGHGMQVEGENYLIPVDARLEGRADLAFETVSAELLLGTVLEAEDRISIVMLDACRDNPMPRSFAASTRSAAAPGLAEIQAGTGAFIAFATAPGSTALDGLGRHSPFTAALLRHLKTPGLEINLLMNEVRREVFEKTEKMQRPWVNTALLGNFYFVPPEGPAPVLAAVPPPGEDEALQITALERVEGNLLRSREARRGVQEGLDALGYAPGRPDGRFGPGTRAAIRSFQAATRLEPTGYVDRLTLESLERQVARLPAPAEEPPPPAPAPSPPEPELAREERPSRPPAGAAAPSPAAMGVCTMPGGAAWASERILSYAQCQKLGGAFKPY